MMIRACGGHGFSYYSGLPHLMNDTFADMILEGENSIMALQVARFLLKCARLVFKGTPELLKGSVKYISKIMEPFPTIPAEKSALKDTSTLITIFEKASLYMVKAAS